MRAVLLALCLPTVLFAQERTHDVTPDDYFTLNTILEIAVSPDGKHVAYVLAVWDKAEDNRKSDLWVIGTDGKGKPTKLTFDRANDRHPKWSADGKHLYFLGNRKKAAETKPPFDGPTQVWRVAADGSGEVKAITREAGGVSGYDYAAKADAIYFSKDKEHADQDEFAKLRAKAKLEYGHGVRKVSEIHKLDVTAWRTEKVVDDTRYVREFAVTQDGKKIAMVSALDDTVVKSEGESRVDVCEAGKVTTPPTDSYRKNPKNSPYAWLENLCWNPDGTRFAFTAVHDAFPAEIVIGSLDGSQWIVGVLNRKEGKTPWEVVGYGRGFGAPLKWNNENYLIGLSEAGGVATAFRANAKELNAVIAKEEGYNIAGFDRGEMSDKSVFIATSPKSMQQLINVADNNRAILDPSPHTATWKLPSVQHITWKAPDGSTVGGVLELPPGYKKGDKLPLVVASTAGRRPAPRPT